MAESQTSLAKYNGNKVWEWDALLELSSLQNTQVVEFVE